MRQVFNFWKRRVLPFVMAYLFMVLDYSNASSDRLPPWGLNSHTWKVFCHVPQLLDLKTNLIFAMILKESSSGSMIILVKQVNTLHHLQEI